MTKQNEFSENPKNEDTIKETLTISRFLKGIRRKEFHKLQDVVKKKTTAVENYIGRQDIDALDSSQSHISDVFSSYVLFS